MSDDDLEKIRKKNPQHFISRHWRFGRPNYYY
jgi:hypothetical protein